MNELAVKLKVLRAERGWSQEELAKRSGVCVTSISFIETGKRDNKVIRVETLVKLAKAFGIEPNELIKYIC